MFGMFSMGLERMFLYLFFDFICFPLKEFSFIFFRISLHSSAFPLRRGRWLQLPRNGGFHSNPVCTDPVQSFPTWSASSILILLTVGHLDAPNRWCEGSGSPENSRQTNGCYFWCFSSLLSQAFPWLFHGLERRCLCLFRLFSCFLFVAFPCRKSF